MFCPGRLKPHFETIPFHSCVRVHKPVRHKNKKKHSRDRFHKDAISENGFTGVRVDEKAIHVKSMGFQNYLDSCGWDQLTSGTNHSLSKNAFSFYIGSISAVSRVRSLILGWQSSLVFTARRAFVGILPRPRTI